MQQYCAVLGGKLEAQEAGDVVIDMDEVADAVDKEGEKPAFYVSEESQQRKFTCDACDEFNDILGRFGYCSSCGTRNDLSDFLKQTVPAIREHLNSGSVPEDSVRDAVAAFDSLVAQYAKQLAQLVPLTERRRNRLLNQRFLNLDDARMIFKGWFDIDISANMKEGDFRCAERMFFRRHVYEHNGGEVDQRYLGDSGDTSVRLKQHIHETLAGAHDLLSSLAKMARGIHEGFHQLFPPLAGPIKAFGERKARIAKYARNHD